MHTTSWVGCSPRRPRSSTRRSGCSPCGCRATQQTRRVLSSTTSACTSMTLPLTPCRTSSSSLNTNLLQAQHQYECHPHRHGHPHPPQAVPHASACQLAVFICVDAHPCPHSGHTL